MGILLQIECDFPGCSFKESPEGANISHITNISDDPTEFVIDQHFYMPAGWTRSDEEEPLEDRFDHAYYCPFHKDYEAVRSRPSGLCWCGCGRRTKMADKTDKSADRIGGQPMRFLRGHKKSTDLHDRYVITEDGCWSWTGYTNQKGYPMVRYNLEVRMGHIVFYERAKGPIPEGLELDHLCGKRDCVNPEHLEAVTHQENVRRSRVTKLADRDVRLIRESEESRASVAERYGITPEYVSDIRSGRARGAA